MADEQECPGAGKCHGCMKWCAACGDVTHVCDMRLRGERCDEHRRPRALEDLRRDRRAAEALVRNGKAMLRQGHLALSEVEEQEAASRAYAQQVQALEDAFWNNVAARKG